MNARQKAKKYKKILVELYKVCNYKQSILDKRELEIIKVAASMTINNEELTQPGFMDGAVRRELIHMLTKDESFKQLVEFYSVNDFRTQQTTVIASLKGIKPRLEDEDES